MVQPPLHTLRSGEPPEALEPRWPMGVLRTDARGRCAWTSGRAEDLLGLCPEGAPGGDWLAAVHPDQSADLRAGWRRAVEREEPFVVRLMVARADGRVEPVHVELTPQREAGVFRGHLGVVVELGPDLRRAEIQAGRDRVLQELALGASLDEVLQLLVESAERAMPGVACSVLLMDATQGVLRHGAAPSLPEHVTRAIDGIPVAEGSAACGTSAFRRERFVIEDALTHPYTAAFVDLVRAHGLRAVWSEPIFSSRAEVLGTFAIYFGEPRTPGLEQIEFMKTTAHLAGIAIESKRADQELSDSEERFRQLAVNIREVFWLTDWRSNRVLYVSPAYEAVWGRSCASLYERPASWVESVHPDDRERVFEAFRRDAPSGDYEEEYRILRADGSLGWIYDRAFPIRDEAGRVYRVAGISEDVTERKRTEVELKLAHDQLEERVRERTESLRMAKHSLEREVEEREKVQEELRSMASELVLAEERERRALAVDLHDGLNQIITLARMKLGALRDAADGRLRESLIELEGLVDRADGAARSLTFQLSPPVLHDFGFEAGVQWLVEDVRDSYGLRVELHEPDHPAPMDERIRVLLFRAVRELLINVAKHAEPERVAVRLTREGALLRVEVEDDGKGFDPSTERRAGFGLFSIRERLRNLGGEMQIHARPGQGTRVVLLSPLSCASAGLG